MPDLTIRDTSMPDSRYPLYASYLYRFDQVAELYDHSPHDPESFHRRAGELAEWDGDRSELARVLRQYNLHLDAPSATMTSIERLSRRGSLVVIGGQQPGVLTGPLYTFWKAVAVLNLAETLSRQGREVVPVFWVGAEDHDLAEIASVSIPGPAGRVETVTYSPGAAYPARTSVGHLPAGEAALAFLDQVEPFLWPSEYRAGVMDVLRATARSSTDLGEWFARLLLHLLGQRGLVVANPLLPGLRRLQAPAFEGLIRENRALADAFFNGRERVSALGFEPQVDKDPAAANLYLYEGTERVPLFRERSGGFARGRDRRSPMTAGELIELARSFPERLSPNVVLRPVVQDQIFPVLAYVGGPGETSYYGLYREVFRVLGRRMPIIYPRPSVTLVEPAVERHLKRSGLTAEVALDLERLQRERADYLSEADPVGIDRLFDRVVRSLREFYSGPNGVSRGLAAIDPALESLAGQNLAKVTGEVEWLRKKAWQRHRQNCQEAVARFDSVAASLRPLGDFQERVLNIFPFLVKYGPGLARQLATLPIVPDGGRVRPGHRLVSI